MRVEIQDDQADAVLAAEHAHCLGHVSGIAHGHRRIDGAQQGPGPEHGQPVSGGSEVTRASTRLPSSFDGMLGIGERSRFPLRGERGTPKGGNLGRHASNRHEPQHHQRVAKRCERYEVYSCPECQTFTWR